MKCLWSLRRLMEMRWPREFQSYLPHSIGDASDLASNPECSDVMDAMTKADNFVVRLLWRLVCLSIDRSCEVHGCDLVHGCSLVFCMAHDWYIIQLVSFIFPLGFHWPLLLDMVFWSKWSTLRCSMFDQDLITILVFVYDPPLFWPK